jgi:rhodanese-related sulfurtransferase
MSTLFPTPAYSTAAPAVTSVTAETVRVWLAAGEAVLIDVREPDEYADEHIAGAVLLPLSSLDAGQLPEAAGKRRVLQCLTGKRSALALQKLADQGMTDLLHLDGGLLAYKTAGGATVEADEAVAA